MSNDFPPAARAAPELRGKVEENSPLSSISGNTRCHAKPLVFNHRESIASMLSRFPKSQDVRLFFIAAGLKPPAAEHKHSLFRCSGAKAALKFCNKVS